MELFDIRNLTLPIHELHRRLDDAIRADDINAVYDAREEAIRTACHLGPDHGMDYMGIFTDADMILANKYSGQQGPAVVE